MHGRATRVVLPALVVLALVGVVGDRIDGSAPARIERVASAVGVAPRHALHPRARRRRGRRRAPRLRTHAEEGHRSRGGLWALSPHVAPFVPRLRRRVHGLLVLAAHGVDASAGRGRRGRAGILRPAADPDDPGTGQTGCVTSQASRGSRSPSSSGSCSPPSSRTSSPSGVRAAAGDPASSSLSSSPSSSTRRSTTCAPRPTRGGRSSLRMPASSACSPRTAFRDIAAETSDEYLSRVLRDLELDSGAVERLTRLFTRAKFSQHDVDIAMKEEAIGALEQVRDELRLARERPALVLDDPGGTGRRRRVRRDLARAARAARRTDDRAARRRGLRRPGDSSSACGSTRSSSVARSSSSSLLALRRAYPNETRAARTRIAAPEGPRPRRASRGSSSRRRSAVAGTFDLHYRLVPRLRTIAVGLLSSRRRVSLEQDPEHGARDSRRRRLGARAPGSPASRGPARARASHARELARIVDALEAI